MKRTLMIEIDGVLLSDFNDQLLAPEFIESMEGGVRVLFYDINGLKDYQAKVLLEDSELADLDHRTSAKGKINSALDKALHDHQIVLDAIKAYAKALFSFVFKGEGHRQDKLYIIDTMIGGIQESYNSWELGTAIKEATFELGDLSLNNKLTFNNYAHNDLDYDFGQIKNQLIVYLKELELTMAS